MPSVFWNLEIYKPAPYRSRTRRSAYFHHALRIGHRRVSSLDLGHHGKAIRSNAVETRSCWRDSTSLAPSHVSSMWPSCNRRCMPYSKSPHLPNHFLLIELMYMYLREMRQLDRLPRKQLSNLSLLLCLRRPLLSAMEAPLQDRPRRLAKRRPHQARATSHTSLNLTCCV